MHFKKIFLLLPLLYFVSCVSEDPAPLPEGEDSRVHFKNHFCEEHTMGLYYDYDDTYVYAIGLHDPESAIFGGSSTYFVAKFTRDGDLVDKNEGFTGYEFKDIEVMPDGNVLLAGNKDDKASLVVLDGALNILKEHAIQQFPDSDYVGAISDGEFIYTAANVNGTPLDYAVIHQLNMDFEIVKEKILYDDNDPMEISKIYFDGVYVALSGGPNTRADLRPFIVLYERDLTIWGGGLTDGQMIIDAVDLGFETALIADLPDIDIHLLYLLDREYVEISSVDISALLPFDMTPISVQNSGENILVTGFVSDFDSPTCSIQAVFANFSRTELVLQNFKLIDCDEYDIESSFLNIDQKVSGPDEYFVLGMVMEGGKEHMSFSKIDAETLEFSEL